MNINMLRDADDNAGFYAAACGATDAWRGAVLNVSEDAGESYAAINAFRFPSTMGTVIDVLGNFFGGNIPDEINSFTVELNYGSLSSVGYSSFVNGTVAAVVGDEILFFRTATLNEDGTYTISGLLRGRRGSEYAMSLHEAGERFVLLDIGTLVRVAQNTADIGLTKLYKAVSVGGSLATTTAYEFANIGAGLKPYAPVHLGGGVNEDGDVTLTWTRRTRISGEWRDAVEVPLGEASEEYEVEIYDSADYDTVVRTITGLTEPTTPYSAADQTTDLGNVQNTIYFAVYQMSEIVGRGYVAYGTSVGGTWASGIGGSITATPLPVPPTPPPPSVPPSPPPSPIPPPYPPAPPAPSPSPPAPPPSPVPPPPPPAPPPPPYGTDAITTAGAIDPAKYEDVADDFWAAIGYRFGAAAPTSGGTAYHERARIPYPVTGPPDNNPYGRPASYGYSGTYQDGLGVWQDDAGGYSSNSLAIAFQADAPTTHIGVANIEASDMSNGEYSFTPELSWVRYGQGLDAVEIDDPWRDDGYPTYKPTAYARNQGRPGWGCQVLFAFQPDPSHGTHPNQAFVCTTGANTMQNRMGYWLPAGLVCTAIAISNSGEFAFHTCWRKSDTRGVLVVVSLTSLGDGGTLGDPDPYAGNPNETSWGEARIAMPGRPGISNYAYGKVIGQILLPTNMRAPTGITCTTSVDRASYMSAGPAHSGCWADATYPSFASKDRTEWSDGGYYGNVTAHGGVLCIVSRTEQTACFVDLGPLFQYYRYMYFDSTLTVYNQTLNVGDGAGQWPFTFTEAPSQIPTILTTVGTSGVPVSVHAAPWGPADIYIGTEGGSILKYNFTGTLIATWSIGANITCIRQMKEKAGGAAGLDGVYTIIATCRGERAIKFVRVTDGAIVKVINPTIAQLLDPIAAEDTDNNTAEGYAISVADYSGERVVGFMYGPYIAHSIVTPPSETSYGPTGGVEYGSGMDLPGKPWGVAGANIS